MRPQIVNVHFVTGQSLYALALAPAFGHLTVLSAHGSDLLRPRPSVARLLPWMLGRADALVAVSQDLADRAAAFAPGSAHKIQIIPNGIDLDFWSAATEVQRAAPLILAAGRLEPVKGFDVLIGAFARVRARLPQARLEIVGEGAQRDALLALAAERGVADALSMPGRLAPEALRRRMQAARVFAMPSRSEGLPLAALEAMAAGAPIVAPAVGGLGALLADNAGRLVRSEDEPGLAEALISVIEDQAAAEKIAARALGKVRDYSLEMMIDLYFGLFTDLFNNSKKVRLSA